MAKETVAYGTTHDKPCRPKPCRICQQEFVPENFRYKLCRNCRGHCQVSACQKRLIAHGYCAAHLWHFERYGDPGPAAGVYQRAKGRVCSVFPCPYPVKSKIYCSTHYARFKAHGVPGPATIMRGKPRKVPCEITGCTRLSDGDGLCRMHYERRRKHGELGPVHPLRLPAGSRRPHPSGYMVIWVDGESVLEHRHIMAQYLGRPLLRTEVVHHIDGNKTNNAIANLEIWHIGHPPGQRLLDKITWAKELLALYEPELPKLAAIGA